MLVNPYRCMLLRSFAGLTAACGAASTFRERPRCLWLALLCCALLCFAVLCFAAPCFALPHPRHAPWAHAFAVLRCASDSPRYLQKRRARRLLPKDSTRVALRAAPAFFVRSALLKSHRAHAWGAARMAWR
jgi:hypothetical protein